MKKNNLREKNLKKDITKNKIKKIKIKSDGGRVTNLIGEVKLSLRGTYLQKKKKKCIIYFHQKIYILIF